MKTRSSRPGAPPGIEPHELDLVPSGGAIVASVIDYGPDTCTFDTVRDPGTFLAAQRPDWSGVRWIRVTGLSDMTLLRAIAETYALHPLAIEDLLHREQRPKVEDYPGTSDHAGQLFIVAQLIRASGTGFRTDQISFLLSGHTLISFEESVETLFQAIDHRIQTKGSRLRLNDASFLLYSLLDAIVDHVFPALESLSLRIEDLEEAVFDGGGPDVLKGIHQGKRDLMMLRRTAWPMRELINQLHRDNHEGLSETTRTYMRDAYDNLIQALDLIETYREVLNSLAETYLSTASQRLNDIVKTLTIISTIFVPLTFFAGVYGMNMPIPENESEWSYPLFWAFCATLVTGMILMFRRRGWL